MKILFISLGCDKNLVDSEKMLGKLSSIGYEVTDDETCADVIVINTCCFILDAKQESIDTILEMAEYKKSGSLKALIVTGCLSQRYGDEILSEIPEVDAVLGTKADSQLIHVLDEIIKNGNTKLSVIPDVNGSLVVSDKRLVTTGGHYAYLKIAEGCNKRCTYCIIPKIRGNYISVPMDELVSEAKYLVSDVGVKELILVAQETTVYGVDLYGKKMLPELLKRLCEIEGLVWIRILYCYPEEVTDELIETIASSDKICHYLDIPIQHASDSVLRNMGRRTTQAEIRERIEQLRKRIPDICLRTTFISGFPGETKEDHQILYHFINETEFDRLGVFTYSREEDTPAAVMENQIPEEIKEARRDELMELQQEIAFEKAEGRIGQHMLAMIEGKLVDDDVYIARTYLDAPNVDGYLFIHTYKELLSGTFVKVVITGSNEYDLIGELEDEYCQ